MGATVCCLQEDRRAERVTEGQDNAIGNELSSASGQMPVDAGVEAVTQQADLFPPLPTAADRAEEKSKLETELQATSASGIQVRRILLRRNPGDLLGMDLQHGGDHLIVTSIHPGRPVDRHNRSHGPDQQIRVNDLIVGVNDISGNDQAMVDTCKEHLEVTLITQPAALPP
mmetsp:Transcript_7824/g.17185  ORF Transcript_7824/g.17185 Transcript_7824/m.17185 type:complete len:171 (-) Transcript_7824:184-696(-)